MLQLGFGLSKLVTRHHVHKTRINRYYLLHLAASNFIYLKVDLFSGNVTVIISWLGGRDLSGWSFYGKK